MTKGLRTKIKKIKLLIFDVDGVLTNGGINIDHEGKEFKIFDVKEGFAIVLARRAGYKTAIISARRAKAVTVRAKDLKIDKVYQDAQPKTKAYARLLKELKLKDNQVCFIGDDLADLGVLKKVGLAVAPANAVSEVKRCAHYVTKKEGGQGAVRELIEMILKTNGQWTRILKHYA